MAEWSCEGGSRHSPGIGELDRRRMLMGGAAALAVLPGSLPGSLPGFLTESEAAGAAADTLGALAGRCGLRFGSAFDTEALDAPEYGELILRQSTHVGNLNSFKYDWLRGEGVTADFTNADRLLRVATHAGLPFTAATLFWNDYPPAWLKSQSTSELRYLFDAHVDEVVGRYAGRVAAWGVVNEPFAPWDNEPGHYRKGPWYAAFGPGYVARAFVRARGADPNCRLILNEAFCERRDWIGTAVRPALAGLVRRLRDDGVPFDVVGLQGHVQPQHGLDHPAFADFMNTLSTIGVKLEITELDVDDTSIGGTLAERDAAVARHYREFLGAVIEVDALDGITTWGLSDRYTWYREVAAAEKRAKPRAPRPLPFDESLLPKPAFYAIAQAFREGARHRAVGARIERSKAHNTP
ncbi:MAG: endo-1,4-beta-xylanase [Hyphomicrobiaceae bacterium]|nr:endo-1,4-beta-xylanase [Hyphomicrobiaceae bacterium]